MTDQNGAVVWNAAYNAFGEAQVAAGSSVVNNIRFPGQYYDAETGLHYNYYRYYEPVMGRYITPDPIGLAGGDNNLYGYVLNNPLTKTDFFGLWVKRCSRKLGDKTKPAAGPYDKYRHDYLNVSNVFYSFQAGWNPVYSQGVVEVGPDVELDGGRCHTTICDDDKFDDYVTNIAKNYEPIYMITALKGTPEHDDMGARNCQSWTDEVISRAKKEYLEDGNCECFQ